MQGIEALRVMVVDDNLHMRTILITILKSFGVVDILEVTDGATALRRLEEWQPDVVFLDLLMAPVDGIEFAIIVRSGEGSNRELPIVVVSGDAGASRVAEARDAGATEFLAKPIAPLDVWRRLNAVIYAPRPFIRTSSYYGPDRRRRVDPSFRGPYQRRADAQWDQQAAAHTLLAD